MKQLDLNAKRIVLVGGSFISFCIGAAFATGQETLQFYAAFGLKGLLGVLFFMVFNIYVNVNFVEAGRVGQFEKDAQVFRYFGGRFFGAYFDFFAVVFCFSAFILMLAGFFSAIGRTEKNKWDARIGTAVGVIGFSLAVSFVTLALLANIELVGLSQVPILLMLDEIDHTVASLYSIVIFLGIFSTATPLLWTLSSRIAPEHSKRYNTAAALLTAAGIFIALKIPFNRLVNLVLTINGYAGFLLFGFILWSNVRYWTRKKG